MIVIYNRNDSGQYHKTKIMIVFTILAKARLRLALAIIINYDRKLRSKLERNFR